MAGMKGSVKLYWYAPQFTGEVKKARDRGLAKCAEMVAQKASDLAPKDTGRLAASINWATKNQRRGPRHPGKDEDAVKSPDKWGIAVIGTSLYYGRFVEFGTRRMSAKPYLRPARDALARQLPKVFRAEYEQAVREMRAKP